uniref:Keratin n=1 Tax=Pelusios castaneus TaxID=367368 RepID=A0A8C8SE46_9SAUR
AANECYTPCAVPGSQPVTDSFNETCVRPCPDSIAVIQLSPVALTLPGPILNSFSQHTVVGSSGLVGTYVLFSSGSTLGYGDSLGYGVSHALCYRGRRKTPRAQANQPWGKIPS